MAKLKNMELNKETLPILSRISLNVCGDIVYLSGWVSQRELLAGRDRIVKDLKSKGFRCFAVKSNGFTVWWTVDGNGHKIDRRCGIRVEHERGMIST